jgi:uncharacterized protein YjbI with pentapeptide repeats
MLDTLIVVASVSLLTAFAGVWIALKIQQRRLLKIQLQQEAWERAQEGHQRIWEVRQGKHALEIEKKLTAQIQEIQDAWQTWEAQDAQRAQTFAHRYETSALQLSMEFELARLPRVEETPLPSSSNDQRQHAFTNWQPPRLQGANLSKRDLSYRYLGRSDLREAQMTNTILYMADLSGATLAGADLSGADLSGANLSGTDLRNTTMTNANLLVADLHNAVLIGANLRGARNLTPQQVHSAIYDSTTLFDAEADITVTHIPGVRAAPTTTSPTSALASTPASITSPTQSTKTNVEPTKVKPVESSSTDRAIPKPLSLKPTLLLPLPFEDSQTPSSAIDLSAARQQIDQTGQADKVAQRQKLIEKKRARAN